MPAIRRRCAFIAALCMALMSGVPACAQPAAGNPVAANSNAFAVDFYKALRSRPGNLFFSPINIATAFSMAYSGARGETAVQMRKVLHITQGAGENDKATGELARAMASETEGSKLAFANAVWVDRRLPLKGEYQQSLAQNYHAELPRLDFENDREGARTTINRWVEGHTAGKIHDLLQFPPDGPMVITSAVYMKASWATPFKTSETRDGDFHLSRSVSAPVPFMHITAHFDYFDGGVFQAVAIPYGDGDLSMILLVPKETEGLARLEAQMSEPQLETWLGQLKAGPARTVALSMPKYRLEDRIELNSLLQGLGMRDAFDSRKANLSGITPEPLFIKRATHQSFLAVDEAGTEAAAATAMEIEVSAYRVGPPPVVVRADRPFLFLVRDTGSGAIVFMGRLATPGN
jgi:serpin B